ncbi:hypothetical protein ABZ499_02775 [Streptomyces sp. NPDC019990]|uniref:hypothetical protein n=1 Tax=Streptomyces sp. NPDC019990 TaxID=3154693 RepID=UPI0033D949D1
MPGAAVRLLAAALRACRTVIAHRRATAKSNEIPAFAPLLDRIDLRGVVVTPMRCTPSAPTPSASSTAAAATAWWSRGPEEAAQAAAAPALAPRLLARTTRPDTAAARSAKRR